MADARTCYAGDLTSDAIGKTVVIPEVGFDAAFEAVLDGVSHDTGMTGKPITELRFRADDEGFDHDDIVLDHTVTVEVRS